MTIQNATKQDFRVSTGAVRFGDDYPGFFFRGDEAIGVCQMLDFFSQEVQKNDNQDMKKIISRKLLELSEKLKSCVV